MLDRRWKRARRKVEEEGRCRVCGRTDRKLEAAHVLGRTHDTKLAVRADLDGWEYVRAIASRVVVEVHPDRIVPLCTDCHASYDAHRLDLLPYLSTWEQVQAVHDAPGIFAALRRTTGTPEQARILALEPIPDDPADVPF